ncbi:MAG TPA: modification methylase, partial [Hyphomicrobiaceae bacterium]|nr:modification methylase [Hyphomicrobiaceae bacterium]
MSMRQPTPGALFQDRVLVGDCLEVLATLPSASVDLVFADPPYNLQ